MRRFLAPLITLGLLILVWFGVDAAFDLSPVVFPGPLAVWHVFQTQWASLLHHTGVTMLEALLGFVIAAMVAYAFAVLFVQSTLVEDALYPFAVALKSMPLVALAPILIVWLGQGLEAKVVMAALVAFFPILVGAVDGLRSADPDLLRLFKAYGASGGQRLGRLLIPASMDLTFAGLKVASSLAVVGAVIAELVSANAGIGYLVKLGAYNLDTSLMFAAVICIGAAGAAFFGVVVLLHRRVVFWSVSGARTF